jgi:hypothetical protein
MEVTQQMLEAAMKEAVKLGMYPQVTFEEAYLRNWANMRKVLEAAFSQCPR